MSKQRDAQRRSSERSERYKQCSNALPFMSKRYKRYKRYTFLSKGLFAGNKREGILARKQVRRGMRLT